MVPVAHAYFTLLNADGLFGLISVYSGLTQHDIFLHCVASVAGINSLTSSNVISLFMGAPVGIAGSDV